MNHFGWVGRCPPIYLHQNASTNFIGIGRWWKVSGFVWLIVDRFDDHKIMPIDRRISNWKDSKTVNNSVSVYHNALHTHLFLSQSSPLHDAAEPLDGVANWLDTSLDRESYSYSRVRCNIHSSIGPSAPSAESESSCIVPAIWWNTERANAAAAENRIDSFAVRGSSNSSKIDVHCVPQTALSISQCLWKW